MIYRRNEEWYARCDPEAVAAWADALDAAEAAGVPQIHGQLRVGDGRCCLGVLDDLKGGESPDSWGMPVGGYLSSYGMPKHHGMYDPPISLECASAAVLNDRYCLTFSEIATILRGGEVERIG